MTEDRIALEELLDLADERTLDEVFGALADPIARHAVAHLHDHPRTTIDRLAEVVSARDATATHTVATPEDRDRIRVTLHHVTLPKLDEYGYVDFDPETGTVVRTGIPRVAYEILGIEGEPTGDDGRAR